MLKTLDKYIIKKYLTTFFYCVMIFSIVAVAIDFSEKVDDYIEDNIPIKSFIKDYYVNYIPHINGLLWPVYAMLTVIFFTSRMAYNSEIISIFNAGTSFYRLMWPYFIAGAIVSALHLFGNHFVIPHANKGRVHFENTYIWKFNYEGKTKDIHMYLNDSIKMYMRRYSVRDSLAYDFTLEEFENSKLKSKLFAARAEYQKEEQIWRLRNYRVRTISPDGMYETLTSGKVLDTMLNVAPGDLERRDNMKETMTTPELVKFINAEKKRGARGLTVFEVERHRRTADAFTVFILTFIGMAVASRKVRGGMGLHLAIGAGLSASYVFLSKFSMTFSTSGNWPPAIGVWIPNIIFVFVIIVLIVRAQK
ncbi:MAG: LptF/LptG family permease [Bacteroidota bacterium]